MVRTSTQIRDPANVSCLFAAREKASFIIRDDSPQDARIPNERLLFFFLWNRLIVLAHLVLAMAIMGLLTVGALAILV